MKIESYTPVVAVVPNAALTPKYMMREVEKGNPVSLKQSDEHYEPLEENPSFDVPLEHTRGVTINDLWNESIDAPKRLKKFFSEHPNSNEQ